MNLTVELTAAAQAGQPPADAELGFGKYFSDHMYMVEYEPVRGWHDSRIVPHQPLSLDPASATLHYAQQVFEGLKAYRGQDGGIRLFRYRDNLERLNRSAQRMCMPSVDIDHTADALKQLVLADQRWIPSTEGCSLYIRPTLIATDAFLGIRPSERYLLYIILSPVGAYYAQGFSAISILVQDKYVRAVPRGVGEAKTGGNYAASLTAQEEAKQLGFAQVLWLDGKENRFVEEVGTMNMFFLIDDEVVTPPLSGSILPGVTRDSILTVLRHWGEHRVSERRISIDEVTDAARSGRLREVFGTGTAAVVSPVGSLRFGETTHQVGDGQTGPLSQRLFDYLLALQYGRAEDPFGWVERIDT